MEEPSTNYESDRRRKISLRNDAETNRHRFYRGGSAEFATFRLSSVVSEVEKKERPPKGNFGLGVYDFFCLRDRLP